MEHIHTDDFDVLRLIEHGKSCYVSSENVRGVQLIYWLKDHTSLPKEELFGWIRDLAYMLAQIHKCRGQPSYRYVNPYSVIVTEDNRLYYLDAEAGSNEERIQQMKRPNVREYFLPGEASYYQKASKELDVYGLGKTIQYMIAVTEIEPALTRKEEKKLQNVIQRCLAIDSKHPCERVEDLLKMLPKYRKKASGKPKRWKVLAVLVILVTVLAVVCIICLPHVKGEEKAEAVTDIGETGLWLEEADEIAEGIEALGQVGELFEEMEKNSENASTQTVSDSEWQKKLDQEVSENEALHMELGLIYFLEAEDYLSSKSHFSEAQGHPAAKPLATVCLYLERKEEEPEEVRQALKSAQEGIKEEPEMMQRDYWQCLLKGYMALDDPADDEDIIRLGEKCLAEEWSDDFNWIRGCVAAAYERKEDYGKAESLYTEWMQKDPDGADRQELYEKLSSLYEADEKPDYARSLLRDGIEEFPSSLDLRLRYAGILCQDDQVGRDFCIEEMNTCIRELPQIQEEEEFQKLLKENGMKIKKGKVCEERSKK